MTIKRYKLVRRARELLCEAEVDDYVLNPIDDCLFRLESEILDEDYSTLSRSEKRVYNLLLAETPSEEDD